MNAERYGRQHHIVGAIGSVLNGSRKPRWDTRRATGTLVLLPLGAFTASMAVGAESIVIGMVAACLLTAGVGLIVVEFRQRRRLALDIAQQQDLDDWDDMNR